MIRVLRQKKQIRDRIAAIELEIANLSETDLAKLKAKADVAATEGHDLLEEMEASINVRVILIKHKVEEKSTSGASI